MAAFGSSNIFTASEGHLPRARSDIGENKIGWASRQMPILDGIRAKFERDRPFNDLNIGICLHIEAKTAVWVRTLITGGARVFLTGSPGTTQDDIVEALSTTDEAKVFGSSDDNLEDHLKNCSSVLQARPDLIADNGGDLHRLLSELTPTEFRSVRGATEETTTGANRLREGGWHSAFPTYVVNDTRAKRIIENRFGVGSSTVEALTRATNLMLHGKIIAIVGYGFCGSGIAHRFRGMGAHVLVVEKDTLSRLEAHLEGFRTALLHEALPQADMVVTATGQDVLLGEVEFDHMADGCILANAGHFASEIDTKALATRSCKRTIVRNFVEEFKHQSGQRLYLVASANPVNLAVGDGNPTEVMDLGLALQALSLERLAHRKHGDVPGIYPVPSIIEDRVARLALAAWIDRGQEEMVTPASHRSNQTP